MTGVVRRSSALYALLSTVLILLILSSSFVALPCTAQSSTVKTPLSVTIVIRVHAKASALLASQLILTAGARYTLSLALVKDLAKIGQIPAASVTTVNDKMATVGQQGDVSVPVAFANLTTQTSVAALLDNLRKIKAEGEAECSTSSLPATCAVANDARVTANIQPVAGESGVLIALHDTQLETASHQTSSSANSDDAHCFVGGDCTISIIVIIIIVLVALIMCRLLCKCANSCAADEADYVDDEDAGGCCMSGSYGTGRRKTTELGKRKKSNQGSDDGATAAAPVAASDVDDKKKKKQEEDEAAARRKKREEEEDREAREEARRQNLQRRNLDTVIAKKPLSGKPEAAAAVNVPPPAAAASDERDASDDERSNSEPRKQEQKQQEQLTARRRDEDDEYKLDDGGGGDFELDMFGAPSLSAAGAAPASPKRSVENDIDALLGDFGGGGGASENKYQEEHALDDDDDDHHHGGAVSRPMANPFAAGGASPFGPPKKKRAAPAAAAGNAFHDL